MTIDPLILIKLPALIWLIIIDWRIAIIATVLSITYSEY